MENDIYKNERVSILLMEYRKAQDSAEHHTNLGWTVTSIICAGSLALLGLVVDNITDNSVAHILGATAILGIILALVMNRIDSRCGHVASQKYTRCKSIEEELKMHHHLEYSPGGPSFQLLHDIVTFCLVVIWFGVLIKVILNKISIVN